MRYLVIIVASVVLLGGCGQGESIVEPGPGEETSTTTPENDDDSDADSEVATDDQAPTTSATTAPEPDDSANAEGSPGTTFLVDENSRNAAVYTELAVSGLVLSLDEQSCADQSASAALEAGGESINAIIHAVQECASPKAVDDFASKLIVAGGRELPSTEAACVSSKLRSGDEYRPFWVALLEEEPFDFLLADLEVQNRYLDLYSECVSVGRAVAQQANVDLSLPTMDCIDVLYTDREFVRVTIEADLSGNADDRARIDGQIAGCLTDEERNALAGT